MSNISETPPHSPAKEGSKSILKPLLGGVAGAILLGAGSFYIAFSGLTPAIGSFFQKTPAIGVELAFVPIEVITISLPPQSGARLVRISGQIEVAPESHTAMMQMQPRFVDVILTYLHAVEIADLRQPAALIHLRAQLLRRLHVVAGGEHVRDFLITEFLLD